MRRFDLHAKQQGIAVVSAMLIAALVASIASYLLFKHQMLINQIENHFAASQSRWISHAGMEWSRAILAEDAKLGPTDSLSDPWARKLPPIPFESATISGFILDEQAFFNLNNLSLAKPGKDSESQALKHFMTEATGNPGTVDALVDWIDKDDDVTLPNGAEDNAYIAQASSYKTANQLLTELGNLSRVMGFTNEMIIKTGQHCVVLPEVTPININTASAEVLRLAFPELSELEVESVISLRNSQPFESTAEVMKVLGDKSKIAEGQISVGSHYFLVNTQVHYGKTVVNASALLKRDGPGWPKVLWKKYT